MYRDIQSDSDRKIYRQIDREGEIEGEIEREKQ